MVEKGQDLPITCWHEIVNGIPIEEENRATVFEFYGPGISELEEYMQVNYLKKGVRAVLVGVNGVQQHNGTTGYAVFVQPHFLRAD